MRLLTLAAIALIGCTQRHDAAAGRSATATPEETPSPPVAVRDSTPPQPYIMTAETTLVVEAEPMSAGDVAREQGAGTGVDTIIVRPAVLNLSVGDTTFLSDLQIQAYDRGGSEVRRFKPAFITQGGRIYRVEGLMLRAVAPGETQFFVEALPRNPSAPRRRPSTAVRVVVR